MNHLNNCHGNITTGNYSNARQNVIFYKKCSFYNRRTPFTFVSNVIRTSQHGISLSVIDIISYSHGSFKRYFPLFVLSEFLSFSLSGNAWRGMNKHVRLPGGRELITCQSYLPSFRVFDFKNRNLFLCR